MKVFYSKLFTAASSSQPHLYLNSKTKDLDSHPSDIRSCYFPHQSSKLVPVLVDLLYSQRAYKQKQDSPVRNDISAMRFITEQNETEKCLKGHCSIAQEGQIHTGSFVCQEICCDRMQLNASPQSPNIKTS